MIERVPTAEKCSLDTFAWLGLAPERARKKLFLLLCVSFVRINSQTADAKLQYAGALRIRSELVSPMADKYSSTDKTHRGFPLCISLRSPSR
jgi:hypothetical protein